MKVLIVGVSTRAMVASAVRAGYQVTSLDYFADCDQPVEARCLSLARDFNLASNLKNLARAARTLVDEVDAVTFSSGIENEPRLANLVSQEKLLGNSAEAVRDVRDPQKLTIALASTGVNIPETIMQEGKLPSPGRAAKHTWLRKNFLRGGGSGVYFWNGKTSLMRGEFLQRFVPGQLASATFLADGKNARLLGMTYQYAGVEALRAKRFWWCGNVAPFSPPGVMGKMQKAADALTSAFGLVGLNGMDFILDEGTPYLLEVNPRCGGSVELLEMVAGYNAFELHANACRGVLPPIHPLEEGNVYYGKGILYARRDLRAPDTSSWESRNIRDIPHPGESISRGTPICSLMGSGAKPEDCWHAVLLKAGMLEAEIYPTMESE